MSMPAAIRHINQTRLLELLLHEGPMSRADLARRLDMMRSTAGNLVSALEEDGLVRDAPSGAGAQRAGGVGRPGRLYELNPEHSYFCGADIGVGYVRIVLLDLQARIVGAKLWQDGASRLGPEEAADILRRLVAELTASSGAAPERLRGLCVAVPGLLDYAGTVLRAPILGWSHVPFLDIVQRGLPALDPILAANDANAFANAELPRLRGEGVRNALFVWIDAGVGGAIAENGKLIGGQNGFAGEFGHIYVGENEMDADSPLPGTLESFIGREALLARNRALGGEAADIQGFLEELAAERPSAKQSIAIWSDALGRGLADLTSIFNPARVVLGGPVAPLLRHCRDRTVDAIRRHLLPGHPIPEMRVSPTGPDAAAIGCAMILHRRFLDIDEDLVFGAARGRAEHQAASVIKNQSPAS